MNETIKPPTPLKAKGRLAIGLLSVLVACSSEGRTLPEPKTLHQGEKITDLSVIDPGHTSKTIHLKPLGQQSPQDLAVIYSPDYNYLLNIGVRQQLGLGDTGDTASVITSENGQTYFNTVSLDRETKQVTGFGGREPLTAPKFLFHLVSLEHHTDTAVSVQPSTASGEADVVIVAQHVDTPS